MQFNNLDKEFNELEKGLEEIEKKEKSENYKKGEKLFFLERAFRRLKEEKGIVVIELPDRIGGEAWSIIICKDGRSLLRWIYFAHLAKQYEFHRTSKETAQVIKKVIEYFLMKKENIERKIKEEVEESEKDEKIRKISERYRNVDQATTEHYEEEILKYNKILKKLE